MPARVLIATASASGIEWLTAKNSSSNGPYCAVSSSLTGRDTGVMRCSRSLASSSARVKRLPTIGMSARSRSR
jgi:hypothetical protein